MESVTSAFPIWHIPLKHSKYLNEKQIQILQKDLEIFTIGDLFKHYPFRYEDRSIITEINKIHLGSNYLQVKGEFIKFETLGEGRTKRLVGQFIDQTGTIEVV